MTYAADPGSPLFSVEYLESWGMTPESMFQELLGLGLNWEVIESRFDQKSFDGRIGDTGDRPIVGGVNAAPKMGVWCFAMIIPRSWSGGI